MKPKSFYWNGTGKYQKIYDVVSMRIPREGEVDSPQFNPMLERLRVASGAYYDLYNNGLCNRASTFRKVFGFPGTKIEGRSEELEKLLDLYILEAAIEQGVLILKEN